MRASACLRDVALVRHAVADAKLCCGRLDPKAIQNDILRQCVETAVDLGETAVVRTHRLYKDLSKVRAGLGQVPRYPHAPDSCGARRNVRSSLRRCAVGAVSGTARVMHSRLRWR